MTTVLNECLDNIRINLQAKDASYCLSGGAEGADSYWSNIAKKHDIETIHYSFEGHRKYCKLAVGVRVKVTPERLVLADPSLKQAKKGNLRSFPCRSDNVNSLLRRNYYQVVDSQSCYAVSRIIHGIVDGGTSWAVQMFIDQHMKLNPFAPCKCWVYDTITNQWFQWVYNMWQECHESQVPTPTGVWTGIGSRELTDAAKLAMENLWQTSPDTLHHQ